MTKKADSRNSNFDDNFSFKKEIKISDEEEAKSFSKSKN